MSHTLTTGAPFIKIAKRGQQRDAEARAREDVLLVAAAPELLAACKAVIASLTAKRTEDASAVNYRVLGILQDAIAKAGGR